MQTVLLITCREEGAVYLGGRLAGEAGAERLLTLPVPPTGPLILEYRPYGAGLLPLTMRLTLSGGKPLLTEDAADGRCWAAVWPGGVIELELMPERAAQPVFRPVGGTEGVKVSFAHDPAPCVRCETGVSAYIHSLPEGAESPACTPLPAGILLSGGLTGGGQYASVLAPDASRIALRLIGRSLTLQDGGNALRMLCPAGDTVGHAYLETWAASENGWTRVSAEPMWEKGAPVRPDTPEKTALAAIEAAQMGLMQEAAGYFAPACPCREALERAAGYDGCVSLRYPLPDGSSAVGLMRMEGGVLRVLPARYTVSGGEGSAWQLTGLTIDDCA